MTDDARLAVLDGIELKGAVNISDDTMVAHVESAIRRGWPQIWPQEPKLDRVCLVGSGPSLADTVEELRDLVFDGALLVTTNAAYGWCIDHNLRPNAQIVLDGRASNARFVDPAIPRCRYYLASQCHPAVFDACAGREHVGIWHAFNSEEGRIKEVLDRYYLGHWHPVAGGTTVGMRALVLLRTLGYLRLELFGMDSCYLSGRGHVVPQPENDAEPRVWMTVEPKGRPDLARSFLTAAWHVKQLEDWLQTIRVNGDAFLLHVHGDGLLAYALQAGADATVTLDPAETEEG